MKRCLLLILIAAFLSCNSPKKKENHFIIEVQKASEVPTIDGKATENIWNRAQWYALDQNWSGKPYEHQDFNGRYKIVWNTDALYILLETLDDTLYDAHKDPLKFWWNDDSIQLFIDEDNSGGLHQYNHNAFAYNIALDGNVVDLSSNKNPQLYNDNITSAKTTAGTITTWEIAVKLFDKQFVDGKKNGNVILSKGKKIGFALAYCDNDGSTERENFIGSVFVPGEDKNQGWINADIFGTLILKE